MRPGPDLRQTLRQTDTAAPLPAVAAGVVSCGPANGWCAARARLQGSCFGRRRYISTQAFFPFPLKLSGKKYFVPLGTPVAVDEDGAGLGQKQGPILWFECIRERLG